jgi:hypothetical protein
MNFIGFLVYPPPCKVQAIISIISIRFFRPFLCTPPCAARLFLVFSRIRYFVYPPPVQLRLFIRFLPILFFVYPPLYVFANYYDFNDYGFLTFFVYPPLYIQAIICVFSYSVFCVPPPVQLRLFIRIFTIRFFVYPPLHICHYICGRNVTYFYVPPPTNIFVLSVDYKTIFVPPHGTEP